MVKKRIAIILARGGSKRLPNKNILKLNNIPLVAWSINAAIKSKLFKRVLVSTDSKKIADISIKYGAEVPFLRSKASDDFSSSSSATYFSLKQSEKYWGEKYNIVAQLMASCPLRSSEDIKKSIFAFEKNSAPSQISCFKYGWNNPWWAAKIGKKNLPKYIFSKRLRNKRSQDLESLFCPSGALWIAKRDLFLKKKNFYINGHRLEPLNWTSAIDIDDEEDFMMAKIITNFNANNKII